jgi:hypothetical protein
MHSFPSFIACRLTLTLLTWSIGWAHNNARKWQMGLNSAFKGLNTAHHVLGILMPTALLPPRSNGKPEAATAVDTLLMGMRMPEICWAVFKRQALKLRDWCIWLVDLFDYMMMHKLTNLEKHTILFSKLLKIIYKLCYIWLLRDWNASFTFDMVHTAYHFHSN